MRTVKVNGTYTVASKPVPNMKLRFTCTRTLRHAGDNIVVLDEPINAMTNSKGYFEVELVPTQADLFPRRFLYRVEEFYPGRGAKVFHIRLDASSPDVVSITSVYRTEEPDFAEVYPTLDQVTRIAADLDARTYDAVSQVKAQSDALLSQIGMLLGVADVNIKVPGLVDGKISASQMPTVRFADIVVANTQAAMLDINATKGRVCIRTDLSKAYALMGNDPTQTTSWVQITDGTKVDSVNGQTGVVQLNAAQVGAAGVMHSHETLSGYQYSATYLKSQVAQTYLSHTVGSDGPTVTVNGDSVEFKDADGVSVFTINPHTGMDVHTATITITYSDGSSGPVTGYFVKQNPFSLDLEFGFAIHGLAPKHFTKGPQLAGFNANIFGSWAQLNALGVPIDSGEIVRGANDEFVFVGLTTATPGMILVKGGMAIES